MISIRRIVTATLVGIVLAVVMFLVANFLTDLNKTETVIILAGPILIGFICGISILRLPWWLHGLFIGLIAGVPSSLSVILIKPPSLPKINLLLLTLLLMAICGFIVELWTTAVFRIKHLSR